MNHPLNMLNNILEGQHIKAVFQPIVSLKDGTIFAYEALSRITHDDLSMNIEDLFQIADDANKSWELEALCRTKALEGASGMLDSKKLFLNINPNILHDINFKEGFTKQKLDRFGIAPEKITFEITERTAITNRELFNESIEHYKNQTYGIAIDDVGSGFSGLNVIVDVKPSYIKFDMHLIRDIDKDETKLLLCKALTTFCKKAGIKTIAEGIESQEELRELIKLDVDLGQGYFLGTPKEYFEPIAEEKANFITTCYSKSYKEHLRGSVYPTIQSLCHRGCTVSMDKNALEVHNMLASNPAIMEFAIVEQEVAVGFMTRAEINTLLGGRYGFSLHSKKKIGQLIHRDFLSVNCDMTVDNVSRLAMTRSYDKLYNPVVVERDHKYYGIVTIKDLLDACTKIEIDSAMHCNPLTGLPGNLLIEKEITSRIFSDAPYCITYYDLDNFKAYNDAYGFENGDLMLKLVAETLKKCCEKNEFIGHIGGDDFIVIADYEEGENFCKSVIHHFETHVLALYRDEDVQRGYIISKNRSGVTENFPLTTISIGGVTSKGTHFNDINQFSEGVAQLKKASKRQPGSYYSIL